jgi:hypothetical protein
MNFCDLCGSESNGYECDWPEVKFIETPIRSLKIGDVVRRAKDERVRYGVATVVSIERRFRAHFKMQVTISIQAPGKPDRTKTFACPDWHVVHARRRIVCGAHLCDRCMIERDPNLMVICKNHWHAWENVA